MPKVFLSHWSGDRSFLQDELIPLLASGGIETWYAPDDIATADEWERKIVAGLQACDWFLIVLTPHSVRSDWVRAEVHWAMEHRKGRVVPVLLSDCDMVDLHLKLTRIQYVDFRQPRELSRAKLLGVWGANGSADKQRCPLPPATRLVEETTADKDLHETPAKILSLELWACPEATDLRINHHWELSESRVVDLVRQYTAQLPDFSLLDRGVLDVIRGLFGDLKHPVAVRWSQAFRAGPGRSVRLDFGIKPSTVFVRHHDRLIQGCTVKIFKHELEIDLWSDDGNSPDYDAVDLDEMGVEFEPMAAGANHLGRCFRFSHNTGFSQPVLRMDSKLRGFPYVHVNLH